MNEFVGCIAGSMAWLLAFSVSAYGQVEATRAAVAVRDCLSAVMTNLPCARDDVDMFRERPACFTRLPTYPSFLACVSNNLPFALAHFNTIATNDAERIVLMSAGWAYDDDYYLRFMDGLSVVAATGGLSRAEWRWFCGGHGDESRLNILALRYRDCLVSNIVDRVELITGDTNHCGRIRSGEARSTYLDWRENAYGPLIDP